VKNKTFDYLQSLPDDDIINIMYQAYYDYFSRNDSNQIAENENIVLLRRLGYLSIRCISSSLPMLYITNDERDFIIGKCENKQRSHIDISYIKTVIRKYKLRTIISEDE
jgi:hypothetical protein